MQQVMPLNRMKLLNAKWTKWATAEIWASQKHSCLAGHWQQKMVCCLLAGCASQPFVRKTPGEG